MAYTRFSDSTWYTYWSTEQSKKTQFKLPNKKLKNGQYLEIIGPNITTGFTYGDLLKKGLGQILDEIRNGCEKGKLPTAAQFHELIHVIDKFEADLNQHFRFWTFMRYEWWLPIRNKIKLILHKK